MTDRIALSGAPGSPYTRKMLGVLRYRRIAYSFMLPNNPRLRDLPRPKVQLLPTFYLPDDQGELQAVTDSTPLIRRFEKAYPGRSLIPPDPALAFLNELGCDQYQGYHFSAPVPNNVFVSLVREHQADAAALRASNLEDTWVKRILRNA